MVLVSQFRSKVACAISCALMALFAFPPVLRADELKLKDGTTISGTIVGFEENSFKVKTSFGFAEVQKDQVVSIVISAGAKKKESEKKSEPAPDTPAAANAPPLGAYRLVSKDSAKARWLKGVAADKQADLIPPGVFDAWADATWATDPESSKHNPPMLRATNGVMDDSMKFKILRRWL